MFNYGIYFINRKNGYLSLNPRPIGEHMYYFKKTEYELHHFGSPRHQRPSWVLARRNPAKYL